MIVTVRGTSGSGKTTLARRVMEHYAEREPVHIPRRKQPLYYNFRRTDGGRPLRVLGHYESPTGGGDTIGDGQDYIRDLVLKAHEEGHDVLYEGLVISSDFSRIAKMHADGLPAAVIVLSTPLDECLRSVAARRAAKGNTTPLNPKTTTEKHRAVKLMIPRFRAAGVPTYHVDREGAYEIACELLELEPRSTRSDE